MISFNCPHCNTKMRADDALAGKRGRCTSCGNITKAPIPLVKATQNQLSEEWRAIQFHTNRAARSIGMWWNAKPKPRNKTVTTPKAPPVTEPRIKPKLNVVTCPDCAGAVSRSAPSCPHCGKVLHKKSDVSKGFDYALGCLVMVLSVAAFLLLVAFVLIIVPWGDL